jgi:hypothetical protein
MHKNKSELSPPPGESKGTVSPKILTGYYTLAEDEQNINFNFRLTYQNNFMGIRGIGRKHEKLPYLCLF